MTSDRSRLTIPGCICRHLHIPLASMPPLHNWAVSWSQDVAMPHMTDSTMAFKDLPV